MSIFYDSSPTRRDSQLVPEEYWRKHKPYRLRRVTSKQGELDQMYEDMIEKAHGKHGNVCDPHDPEYELSLKAYMDKIDELENKPTKEASTDPKNNNMWYTLFCGNPATATEDPNEVSNQYWRKHRPYILRRRSVLSSSDSNDENENGFVPSKFADDEYDEVRKIRMELEARLIAAGTN